MYRAAIAARSELGLQVEPILAAGALVPDSVTIPLIEQRLLEPDAEPGFVLDGYPRNLVQAVALDDLLAAMSQRLDAILFFDLDDAVATERMFRRAVEENRPDDTPEVIARRLATYHEQTEPIIEHYRAGGHLVPLDAAPAIDEVYAQVQSALARLGNDGAA